MNASRRKFLAGIAGLGAAAMDIAVLRVGKYKAFGLRIDGDEARIQGEHLVFPKRARILEPRTMACGLDLDPTLNLVTSTSTDGRQLKFE